MDEATRAAGFVSLVGAGPGDPGLLTIRGRKAIERADVVLYDRLASAALLAAVPVQGQERIHVGKTAAPGASAQEDINRLMVKRANQGARVVRLKGGDPFLFGRGGEEATACVDAGVPFEIIPGVSSITAVPAYAGIPVTHRDDTSTLVVATGHERAGSAGDRVPWMQLGGAGGTMVVLMGVLQLKRWTAELMAGGLSADTPVALVRWGSTPRQETLVSTLSAVSERAEEDGVRPPVVAIVGDVVRRREALAWFDKRPLFGAVVGVTRS
ncbi:MAG: uroporphyrinogen-III C-methyltransferase, partial [Myxococcota bacterium]|nr:uroporphyrinogen-III C-methyltransferase [Myxococcota bacterium]